MSKNRYLYEDVRDLQEAWDALMQLPFKRLERLVVLLNNFIIHLLVR